MSTNTETGAKALRTVSIGRWVVATLLDAQFLAFLSFVLGLMIGAIDAFLSMSNYDEPTPFRLLIIACALLLSIFCVGRLASHRLAHAGCAVLQSPGPGPCGEYDGH
jgi:hypothetical protein